MIKCRWYVLHAYSGYEKKVAESIVDQADKLGISEHIEDVSVPTQNIVEVNTVLRLSPNQEVKHKMLTEINFSALVSIEKSVKDKIELEKIVLIKVPREIYPDLYKTFIYLFSQAGIKNINIEKEVNFEKMYNEKIKTN